MTIVPVNAVTGLYELGKSLGADGPGAAGNAQEAAQGFGVAMRGAAAKAVDNVAQAEQLSIAAAKGKASVDEVVHAVMAAEMSVQAVVSVRNKFVEAYQEVMRMPI